MIRQPRTNHLNASGSWTAGIGMLFFVVGLHGAVQPVEPPAPALPPAPAVEEVLLEEFEPPPAGDEAPSESAADPSEAPDEPLQDLEIPPLPEIITPLTPPEMVEIVPAEKIVERPREVRAPTPPTPRTVPRRPPASSGGSRSGSQEASGAGAGGGSAPGARAGGGKGRFPQPVYPAAARRGRIQGTVILAITVEPSGLPASVSVTQSSGHAVLDSAARDGVLRRWRWPAGSLRRFSIPIRFVLK